MTDAEFQEAIRAERRTDQLGGKLFAEACAAGDTKALLAAVDVLNRATVDGWRLAMRRVGKLSAVPAEIRSAFLPIWIESKMLPLRVGHRPTMAQALRVLMPGTAAHGPLTLYRGARASERRRRLYGFSWTTDLVHARGFAEHWREADGGGLVLSTLAPSEAILLVREDEDYYDEREVVVDPFRLGKVTVVEQLRGEAPRRLVRT